jgi:hypothetical protein
LKYTRSAWGGIKTEEFDMKHIKIFTVGLIVAAALVFAGCNQITSGDPGEEGAVSRSILGGKVGQPPATWTVIGSPPFTTIKGVTITTINGVASNGKADPYDIIVAVAGDGSDTYASTSDDGGNTWIDQATPLPELSRSPSVANYLGDNFLVTAGNSVTDGAFSSDGFNWSKTGPTTTPPTIGIGYGTKASAYGQDINTNALVYVVAGQFGQAAYTTNLGGIFNQISPSITGWDSGAGSALYINTAAYGQGSDGTKPLFVFGGGSARIAYTYTISSTGTPWVAANQTAFTGSDFINVIAFGDGTFVAVGGPGTQGIAAYSTDGINWTTVTNFPLGIGVDVYALAYGDEYFVAGDDAGYIAYSGNGGATWNPVNLRPVLDRVNAIAYDSYSGRFIAVGQLNGGPAVAHTLP